MKTRNFTITGKLLAMTALIAVFSSCSRQLTNISTNTRLQYAQTIAKTQIQSPELNQKEASPEKMAISNQKNIEDCPQIEAQLSKTTANGEKDLSVKSDLPKKNNHIVHPKILKTLASLSLPVLITARQQLASAPLTLQKSNTLSHKQTFLTGYLRTAVICFIIALICSVLAYILSLFWILAVIFWVIGIVFLLLWLLGNV